MRHVVAALGVIFFYHFKTTGAALRAMLFSPFLHLDVGSLATLDIRVPRALAPHAPAVGTIRALHHGVAVSRQINEGPTFQAVNALAQHRPVVEVYKFAVLFAA